MPNSVPTITVLAGTNGAGKSSIGGARLEAARTPFYNPDVETQALIAANPGMTLNEANAAAWRIGKERLEAAIAERHRFNFESTLGGTTITRLLAKAHDSGLRLRIWYCGLNDAELHIARVRARVRRGGHDIPTTKIRERYDASRLNLIRLLPDLTELRLYDNSREADLVAGDAPEPILIVHTEQGRIVSSCAPATTPEWAKPIFAAVMKL